MRKRGRWRWLVRSAALVATATVGISTGGCGLFADLPPLPTPRPSPTNLVVNAGFEDGEAPWVASGEPPRLTDALAHQGTRSMALVVRGEAADEGERRAGAVQQLATPAFPEFVSGFYRVEEWIPNGAVMVLDFALTARGGGTSREVRVVLGTSEPALAPPAEGTGYIYVSRDEPGTGEWEYFSYPVRRAFEQVFGAAPDGWETLDLSLAVRYEAKPAGGAVGAVVVLDDLYVGPQLGNPNRPDEDDYD